MEEGIYLGNISIPIAKGEKGDKGNTGAKGDTGAAGVGISSAEMSGDHLILHLTNGTDIDVGVVVGTGITYITIDENYNIIVVLSDGSEQTVGNIEVLLEGVLSNYYDKTEADSLFSTIDETGNKIDVSINSSTYVMTITLKDKNNTVLSTGTVDLPLESVVVSGSYDSTNKKIVLTLQSGSTIEFSVADLVSGLQSEITSSNKLSADLVDDTNTTNKFVTASDITNWNAKVDTDDYATGSTGGVVKVNTNYGLLMDSGTIKGSPIISETGYGNANSNFIICKGTLEYVLNARIGDIDTALDLINRGGD
jgi:hypothetical protein